MPKIAPDVAPPSPLDEGPVIRHEHDHRHRHTHHHHFEREDEHEGLSAERSPMTHDPRAHDERHVRGRADTPSFETYEQNRTPIRRRPLG
jgi:hypothetical protein